MAYDESCILSETEKREIAEYKRIIEFSEQVLAGTHPRVKIPFHLRPQPKPAQTLSAQSVKKGPVPTPHQEKSRTTTYPIGWQYSDILARKRKRDEMEGMMMGNQAEAWNQPVEDGDSVRAWTGA